MIIRKAIFPIILILMLFSNFVKSEEENSLNISEDIKQLKKDLKTLEKAVYKTSQVSNSSTSTSNSLNEDILTRHLLKLNDIETQFQELTNKFEEVNFKMDKLSKRITKMQSDNHFESLDLSSIADFAENTANLREAIKHNNKN